MKKIQSIPLSNLLGFVILTACSSTTPAVVTPSLQPPASAEVKILPTSLSPSNSIIWQGLQVTMEQAEITDSFITEFDSQREPSPGQKFFWVHVQLGNTGQDQIDIPLPEHFSVLYAATELKPTYGHRKDHKDYTTLEPVILPDQEVDAWLRFDIPVNAELKDLSFVFLPESSQVGVLFSSPSYPYSEDHPTYVWKCEP